MTVKLETSRERERPDDRNFWPAAGADARTASPELQIKGEPGRCSCPRSCRTPTICTRTTATKLVDRYGVDEKEAMASWWNVLTVMDKELKKQGKIDEAKIVSDVMKKAVEPAYNYYKIDAQKVTDKAVIMTGLLVFYVVYTMWWGFAIFYMFDGIGLTMKKAKVKKEV